MISRSTSFSPWRAAAFGLPVATITVAILMMPLPLSLKVFGYWLMPSLPIIAIFLWTLHRPDLLSPLVVLLLGVFMDLLIEGPVGASSLAFLVAYSIVVSQRVYWATLPGPGLLLAFVFVIFVAETTSWLAVSFAHGRLLSPTPALLEAVISVLVFPFVRSAFKPLRRWAGPAV
jgi:rod shape-determining protein MreD